MLDTVYSLLRTYSLIFSEPFLLIKTSIRADRINKASLGSQYVVLEMRDRFSCIAKAFFPSDEKDKLLKANIGNTIVFVGELKAYKYGFASCVEFGDSKVLEIK